MSIQFTKSGEALEGMRETLDAAESWSIPASLVAATADVVGRVVMAPLLAAAEVMCQDLGAGSFCKGFLKPIVNFSERIARVSDPLLTEYGFSEREVQRFHENTGYVVSAAGILLPVGGLAVQWSGRGIFKSAHPFFEKVPREFDGTLTKDLTLVRFGWAGESQVESMKLWTTPSEVNKALFHDLYSGEYGLGSGAYVELAHIPAGEPVRFLYGRASPFMEFQEGMISYQFYDFKPQWISETRPFVKVQDPSFPTLTEHWRKNLRKFSGLHIQGDLRFIEYNNQKILMASVDNLGAMDSKATLQYFRENADMGRRYGADRFLIQAQFYQDKRKGYRGQELKQVLERRYGLRSVATDLHLARYTLQQSSFSEFYELPLYERPLFANQSCAFAPFPVGEARPEGVLEMRVQHQPLAGGPGQPRGVRKVCVYHQGQLLGCTKDPLEHLVKHIDSIRDFYVCAENETGRKCKDISPPLALRENILTFIKNHRDTSSWYCHNFAAAAHGEYGNHTCPAEEVEIVVRGDEPPKMQKRCVHPLLGSGSKWVLEYVGTTNIKKENGGWVYQGKDLESKLRSGDWVVLHNKHNHSALYLGQGLYIAKEGHFLGLDVCELDNMTSRKHPTELFKVVLKDAPKPIKPYKKPVRLKVTDRDREGLKEFQGEIEAMRGYFAGKAEGEDRERERVKLQQMAGDMALAAERFGYPELSCWFQAGGEMMRFEGAVKEVQGMKDLVSMDGALAIGSLATIGISMVSVFAKMDNEVVDLMGPLQEQMREYSASLFQKAQEVCRLVAACHAETMWEFGRARNALFTMCKDLNMVQMQTKKEFGYLKQEIQIGLQRERYLFSNEIEYRLQEAALEEIRLVEDGINHYVLGQVSPDTVKGWAATLERWMSNLDRIEALLPAYVEVLKMLREMGVTYDAKGILWQNMVSGPLDQAELEDISHRSQIARIRKTIETKKEEVLPLEETMVKFEKSEDLLLSKLQKLASVLLVKK